MEPYDFYRTDLVDESEEMVRHRTASEKDRLEIRRRYYFRRIKSRTGYSDKCNGRRRQELNE